MRKTFIAVVATLLVGVAVWGWLRSQRMPAYSYAAVTAELAHLAPASGADLTDERTVSASLRGEKVGALDSLNRKISGRPLMDDIGEFTMRDGPDTIHVTIHHSRGMVGLVEIRSSNPSSKSATAIASGLAASFPKLDCQLKKP